MRFCRACNQRRRFVPMKAEIHSVKCNHFFKFCANVATIWQQHQSHASGQIAPIFKRPRFARGNPSDSAVSYEAQSSTTQKCSNKHVYLGITPDKQGTELQRHEQFYKFRLSFNGQHCYSAVLYAKCNRCTWRGRPRVAWLHSIWFCPV